MLAVILVGGKSSRMGRDKAMLPVGGVPMARLLWPQAQRVHNISVWIACCVGMTGLVFGLGDLLQEAVDGEYGLTRQTGEGLTRDFLWREGSLHYHYYALEALTAFGSLLKKHAPGHPLLTTLKEMYLAPLRLSPDGWSLPSLNDGWYPLTFGSYGAQIVQAARLTGDGALLRLAEEILRRLPELRLPDRGWSFPTPWMLFSDAFFRREVS